MFDETARGQRQRIAIGWLKVGWTRAVRPECGVVRRYLEGSNQSCENERGEVAISVQPASQPNTSLPAITKITFYNASCNHV